MACFVGFCLERNVQATPLGVAHNADHSHPWTGAFRPVLLEAFAERILSRPVLTGKVFVYDDDRSCSEPVTVVEIAPLQDGNAHSVEITGLGGVGIGVRQLLAGWNGTAFDQVNRIPATCAEGKARNGAGGLYTR